MLPPHLPRATFPVNDLPIAPNRAPLPDSPVNDPWTPRATSSGRGGAWSAMHFRRNRAPFPPRTGISSVPLFTWRRKGSLARGHLPGNPPRTSQDRDPGGHIWGKSPQPAPIEGGTIFPDGRERNICHFMDGNRLCANPVPRFGGELATNEPYAHFEADGRPSDGAGSGMNPRRDGHGAGPPPPRTGVAPGLATQNWTAPRGTALPL